MKQLDFPFYKVAADAERQARLGHTIHQKFTCAGCGARQTMEQPNTFFKTGRCEECDHVTDIEAQGCNYLFMTGSLGRQSA